MNNYIPLWCRKSNKSWFDNKNVAFAINCIDAVQHKSCTNFIKINSICTLSNFNIWIIYFILFLTTCIMFCRPSTVLNLDKTCFFLQREHKGYVGIPTTMCCHNIINNLTFICKKRNIGPLKKRNASIFCLHVS